MRSEKGWRPGGRREPAGPGRSLAGSSEPQDADGPFVDDARREAYLEALFRDLEEDFVPRTRGGRRAYLLLGAGFALIGVALVATLQVPSAEVYLSFVLGVNVLAVLCVAAGILLLPERSPRQYPPAAIARTRSPSRRRAPRIHLPLPRHPIRHLRP